MSILILILKIIGILFLLILALAAVILFHPVYYCLEGEKEEELSARGHFWWIFKLFQLEFAIEPDDISIRFRIFGFEKKTDTAEETKKNVPKTAELAEQEFRLPSKEPVSLEKIQKEEITPKSDSVNQKKQSKKKQTSPKKTQKKESNPMDGFRRFHKEITDDRNREAVSHLWQELWYLVSHLKPNYIESDISFSAGDPALTGKITGAISLLPVLYRYDALVYPDFLSEEAYIRGRLKMKGHMALFHFVRSLIRLIRDENIRKLYDKIRK